MEKNSLFLEKKVYSYSKNSSFLCEFSNVNIDGTFNLDFTSDYQSLSANGTYCLDNNLIYGILKFTHVRDRRYTPVEFKLE
jgi:hypothetical protein